jgi:hypothetical protein
MMGELFDGVSSLHAEKEDSSRTYNYSSFWISISYALDLFTAIKGD